MNRRFKITKRLEELFNMSPKPLPRPQSAPTPIDDDILTTAESVNSPAGTRAAITSLSTDLPLIRDLVYLGDNELDTLAAKAEKAHDDLMDLGMNVEMRYSGRMFEVAASMLNYAIVAKSNKIEKKLKAVELRLKKYKMDKGPNTEADATLLNGEGYVITDRNDLLKKLNNKVLPTDEG